MKLRVTNTILIIMLLLNIAFIGSWWMNHSKMSRMYHHGHGMFDSFRKSGDRGAQFLTDQLNFSPEQRAEAEKIFTKHGVKMQQYQAEISRLQKQIFQCLTQNTPDSVHAFMYADSVGMWRVAMQKEFFRNSFRIRQICNDEQKKKYDELIQAMTKRLSHYWARPGKGISKPDSV